GRDAHRDTDYDARRRWRRRLQLRDRPERASVDERAGVSAAGCGVAAPLADAARRPLSGRVTRERRGETAARSSVAVYDQTVGRIVRRYGYGHLVAGHPLDVGAPHAAADPR